MITQEEINNLINSLDGDTGQNNKAPDICGGCIVENDIAYFKNTNGDITLILPIDACITYLKSIGCIDE